MKSFKEKFDFEKRDDEAARIKKKYPDRIPVIVEKAQHCDMPDIDKHKYLVPKDLTVSQFIYVIRKRVKIKAEEAIFLLINNSAPASSELMSTVYENNKDEDQFLYAKFSGESTFG